MKELNPAQKKFVKIKENGRIPPYSLVTGFDINFMYENWLEIVANSRHPRNNKRLISIKVI